MSIINRMLQDLDRRQGTSDPDATLAMSQVRTVPPPRKDREWFWRIIAVLMIAAVGWVGWIAWQLQPREPVVTEQAFRAAENARKPAPAAAPAALARAPEQKPAALPAQPEKPAAAQPAPEPLKLASEIQKPIPDQPAKAAAKKEPAVQTPKASAKAKEAELKASPEPAESKAAAPVAQAAPAPKVEKRDRARTPEERSEAEFRRGAALLNQGRVAEAEESFHAAIASHAGHEAARQALIALSLEQRRIDEARRLLQEGLAMNPANARFGAVLARILIERKDYPAALEAIGSVRSPEQNDAELQMMRGTALQRLGRHAEATEAFSLSLRALPQNGSLWMGLAISLEAQGKKPDAADAFKRAAASGNLGADARDYAEQRARALQ